MVIEPIHKKNHEKHILIADDEGHFRFSASIALRRAGYRISAAQDGNEALRVILDAHRENLKFDLILLDIQMPGLSGLELIEELEKKGVSVPFFAISGFADRETIMELMQRGCLEFFDKPVELENLVNRINGILQGL